MPLIILTGHPCSGKTYRANQIQIDFDARIAKSLAADVTKHKVITIPSHHSSLDPASSKYPQIQSTSQNANPRDQLYNLSSAEKVARAAEFSAIKRALNKNDVVIADGLNYIKGFRYQLWCEAKAAATRCVVVHIAAREDECTNWNRERIKAWEWEYPEEDNDTKQHVEEMTVGGVSVRVGKNVMGELEPESHTAIYGDKVVDFSGPRSRSSSMGGGVSDTDEDGDAQGTTQRQVRNEDGMTLKSLYISDRAQPSADENDRVKLSSLQQSTPPNEQVNSIAPVEPPSPKSALPYAPSTHKSLLMRYEPPSPFTRWDTPLFTIPTSDAHPPYESIWTAIFPPPTRSQSKKAQSQTAQTQDREGKVEQVRQHAATILPKATASDALQVLESGTADVVKNLLGAAREQNMANGEGGELAFFVSNLASSTATNNNGTASNNTDGVQLVLRLPLNTPLSQPMLQRLRRKYTQIQRGSIAHGQGHVSGREDVVRNFTMFLAAEWGTL